MTLSKERLEEKLLEHIKHGGDCEEEDMIRELLERRERDKQEPVGYAFFSEVELMLTNRMVGGMLSVRKIGECPLYAAPPVATISNSADFAIEQEPQSFGNSEQLNSPVTPDGWVAVPVKPTKEMLGQLHPITEADCPDCGKRVTADCEDNVLMSWQEMLAAAPKQESE